MRLLLPLSLLYVGCFVASALTLQVRSPVQPWMAGAPIESFTAALLWMLSLIALLIANRRFPRIASTLFWVGGCAALAVLAIDEV